MGARATRDNVLANAIAFKEIARARERKSKGLQAQVALLSYCACKTVVAREVTTPRPARGAGGGSILPVAIAHFRLILGTASSEYLRSKDTFSVSSPAGQQRGTCGVSGGANAKERLPVGAKVAIVATHVPDVLSQVCESQRSEDAAHQWQREVQL
eukprot:6198186-Pleurochrysis_carterae.AAC.1